MPQIFGIEDDIRGMWTALTGHGLLGLVGPKPRVQARLALLKAILQAEDLGHRYRICTYTPAPGMTMGLAYDSQRYDRRDARSLVDRRTAQRPLPAIDDTASND
ncbi:hypothetical protein ABU614_06545 [Lysobacter firmicutimachus]|uniref:Uncharacterized protein n=1 Tax=Lysobacter firmicutimachus TaxID=1792846 RepID=A0AAU8MWS4_9GAMM